MGMCVLNRAGPGRQSDKPQMHRTLDWTGLSSLVFLYMAKLSSKTSYLESAQVQRITWPPTTTAQEPYVQWNSSDCDGVAVKKAFKGAEVWRSSQLALTGTPGLFNYLYTICLGLLVLYSTAAEWTHIHILRPDHPMLKKKAALPWGIWHQLAKATKTELEPVKKKKLNSWMLHVQYAQNSCPHTTGFIKWSTNQHKAAT